MTYSCHQIDRRHAWGFLVLLSAAMIAFLALSPMVRAEDPPKDTESKAENKETAAAVAEATPAEAAAPKSDAADGWAIKPRLQLHAGSVRRVLAEAHRSRMKVLIEPLHRMIVEAGECSSEGVDTAEAAALIAQVCEWPDTSLEAVTFAPDTQGRARWIVRLDWPVADLQKRVKSLLSSEAGKTILEGVTIREDEGGVWKIALAESTLAYLRAAGERSYLSSHVNLEIPPGDTRAGSDGRSESADLVSCRLNLAQTEKDSGATWLSSFSAITALEYSGRVVEDGTWDESFRVLWPPISGVGAKAVLGRVEQTFFVPDSAFGAATVNAPMLTGMWDMMAGLGQQVLMDEPGKMEIVGEAGPGPIASRVEPDLCITLLPGTGFLPFPDVVIQARARKAGTLMDELREAARSSNKLFREREKPAPWHETTVRERTVFWSDGSGGEGSMTPLVLRPVLFTTKEKDAKDRERDFLILAFTSTSPEAFVRRWLDLPRTKDFRHLPTNTKSNGQMWVNWSVAYEWVQPYLNLMLTGTGVRAVLPPLGRVRDSLRDGEISLKLAYSGLTAQHKGPMPVGLFVLPSMVASSLAPDEGGGSDLSRERLASRRLRLFYHHCKLFKKDMGRWPAELEELEGYIDFAGHPELLELKLSASKGWSEFFSGVMKETEKKEEEDEDEDGPRMDIDLYVFDWSRDAWKLGYKAGTFEHLEKLYIDDAGELHRVERPTPVVKPEPKPVDEAAEPKGEEVKKEEPLSPAPQAPAGAESSQPTPRDGDGSEKE